MAVLHVDRFIDLPRMEVPFGSNSLVHYLVGYYVGTSFRVHADLFTLETAIAVKCEGERIYGRKYFIVKEIVSIEKLNWL